MLPGVLEQLLHYSVKTGSAIHGNAAAKVVVTEEATDGSNMIGQVLGER